MWAPLAYSRSEGAIKEAPPTPQLYRHIPRSKGSRGSASAASFFPWRNKLIFCPEPHQTRQAGSSYRSAVTDRPRLLHSPSVSLVSAVIRGGPTCCLWREPESWKSSARWNRAADGDGRNLWVCDAFKAEKQDSREREDKRRFFFPTFASRFGVGYRRLACLPACGSLDAGPVSAPPFSSSRIQGAATKGFRRCPFLHFDFSPLKQRLLHLIKSATRDRAARLWLIPRWAQVSWPSSPFLFNRIVSRLSVDIPVCQRSPISEGKIILFQNIPMSITEKCMTARHRPSKHLRLFPLAGSRLTLRQEDVPWYLWAGFILETELH